MTTYYKLVCETCQETFGPLRATQPEELLSPDYEDTRGGINNVESLKRFHDAHHGHRLTEVEDEDAK